MQQKLLISEIYRYVYINYPKSYTAQAINLTLKKLHFLREYDKSTKREREIIYKILNKINKLINYVRKM